MITEESLENDDKFYNLGVFKSNQRFFTVPKVTEYQTADKFIGEFLIAIEFYRSEHTLQHTRSIYSPLNFLGDIGGLTDALIGIGSALVYLFQLLSWNQLDSHLLKNIFEQDNSRKSAESSHYKQIHALARRKPFIPKNICLFVRKNKSSAVKGI